MKTYLVTEKQIEELQNTFSMDGNAWWFNARMDEWVETLKPVFSGHESFNVEDSNGHTWKERVERFVLIELDKSREKSEK